MATQRTIASPPPPNLPIAPTVYSESHFDILNNVLRLYFNRLFEALKALFDSDGGKYIQFPHIAAYDTASQYATAANTPTIIAWSATDSISGFTLNVGNTATADVAGVYKITYSMEIANTDNAAQDAIVWLRINGSTSAQDVANSTTIFTVPARKSAGVPSYVCGYSEVVFELNEGDEVGLWWGTTQAASSGGALGLYIYALPAQTTPMAYPAVPSVIGSITFVSRLPL